MNTCKNCNKITSNPIFCSRRCSAIITNHTHPKIKKKIKLCRCGKLAKDRSKYCHLCTTHKDWSKVTYGSMTQLRNYQRNSRIRELARQTFKKSGKSQQCYNCGYNKHIEICHKKAINSFDSNTPISIINAPSNLVALCPNCHWEFDHGFKIHTE